MATEQKMPNPEPWVGTWRPHIPRGPIGAMCGSPGPKYALSGLTGEKQHCITKVKGPSYSFGTRPKLQDCTIGPGPKYQIPYNFTREGYVGTPAFSLCKRPTEIKVCQSPSPFEYSPENATKCLYKTAPAYSLTKRPKERMDDSKPGPATYQLPPLIGAKNACISTAPKYSLYKARKTGGFAQDFKKTPGPAAYNVVDQNCLKKSPPKYTMTARNFPPLAGTKTPGPATYSQESMSKTKTSAPSYTFGLRHSEYLAPFIQNVED